MPTIELDTLDDPRLDAYRDVKEHELAARGGRFIAEGEQVVRRMIASGFQAESILVARRRAPAMEGVAPQAVPVYVLPDDLVDSLIGFKFHSGVMAVGLRGQPPTFDHVLGDRAARRLVVICPEIINTDNLGSIMRLAAAFGADALVLGERCCDPFYRRAVRVSMGAAFMLPILRSHDMLADLHTLRETFQLSLHATVLDPHATPIEQVPRPPRLGLLLGSESQGLHPRFLVPCEKLVTLPMHRGVDSLNVAVAAAVFLYHYTRQVPAS